MISVIIPTYKNRGGLYNSIDSVLHQESSEEIEVIVVDDNGSDFPERKLTEQLMERFEDVPSVKYIKHPENRNGAAARNTGIKAARGEYIAFLDDDDRFLPGKLSKQVEYLKAHPEMDAVYCLACKGGKDYSKTFYEGRPMKEMLMLATCMQTSCLMFRREALFSINGFDEALRRHQDYDLLLRFFAAGHSIGCLKEVLTEIGTNVGENIQSGKKLEETKRYFFEKFGPYIDEIELNETGSRNKVYAKHYAGVFLNHVKQKNFRMAWNVICRYFPKSPSTFMGVIVDSTIIHLKGEA